MADKIVTTNTLAVGVRYMTEKGTLKTIYAKIPNPKNNLTEQQIRAATEPLLAQQSGQVGAFWTNPETGTDFDTDATVHTAYTESQSETTLDLSISPYTNP